MFCCIYCTNTKSRNTKARNTKPSHFRCESRDLLCNHSNGNVRRCHVIFTREWVSLESISLVFYNKWDYRSHINDMVVLMVGNKMEQLSPLHDFTEILSNRKRASVAFHFVSQQFGCSVWRGNLTSFSRQIGNFLRLPRHYTHCFIENAYI